MSRDGEETFSDTLEYLEPVRPVMRPGCALRCVACRDCRDSRRGGRHPDCHGSLGRVERADARCKQFGITVLHTWLHRSCCSVSVRANVKHVAWPVEAAIQMRQEAGRSLQDMVSHGPRLDVLPCTRVQSGGCERRIMRASTVPVEQLKAVHMTLIPEAVSWSGGHAQGFRRRFVGVATVPASQRVPQRLLERCQQLQVICSVGLAKRVQLLQLGKQQRERHVVFRMEICADAAEVREQLGSVLQARLVLDDDTGALCHRGAEAATLC